MQVDLLGHEVILFVGLGVSYGSPDSVATETSFRENLQPAVNKHHHRLV